MDLLATLSEQEKKLYINYYNYESQQVIFNEGTNCNEIGIIVNGEIVITTPTYDDEEETINLLGVHQIYGNVLIFSTNPIYLGTAIARRKTQIATINKTNLLRLLQTNFDFLQQYLEFQSNENLKVKQQSKLLIHKKIRDRILHYLYEQQKIHKNSTIKIESVTKLALILSLPRPSVSRELRKLSNENIIKYQNKKITII